MVTIIVKFLGYYLGSKSPLSSAERGAKRGIPILFHLQKKMKGGYNFSVRKRGDIAKGG
jgi:hypothetical protein